MSDELPFGVQHHKRVMANIVDARMRVKKLERKASSGRSLVATLPTAPVDGQEIAVQNAAMAALGIVWRLKYNAASSYASKWEFIGGAPWHVDIDTSEGTATTSTWVDLATAGPLVTLPFAGDYIAEATCVATKGAAVGTVRMGIANGVATPPAYTSNGDSSASALDSPLATRRRFNAMIAGTDLRMRYWTNAAAVTTSFLNRSLAVTPVRLG